MEKNKVCGRCKEEKEIRFFSKDKRAKSGLQVNCKKCQTEYYYRNRRHYQLLKQTTNYRQKLKEYYLENKEKIAEWRRRYYAGKGHLRVRACHAERRAVKRVTSDGSVTVASLEKKLKDQNYRCAITNQYLESYHIDHIIPLAKGGQHTIDNIQMVLPSVNLSKGCSLLYEAK